MFSLGNIICDFYRKCAITISVCVYLSFFFPFFVFLLSSSFSSLPWVNLCFLCRRFPYIVAKLLLYTCLQGTKSPKTITQMVADLTI